MVHREFEARQGYIKPCLIITSNNGELIVDGDVAGFPLSELSIRTLVVVVQVSRGAE